VVTDLAAGVERSILLIRGHRVLLDQTLAELYGVPVKVLNQAVRRNAERFPEDFMFQLTAEESELLRSQFVTSRPAAHGGRRYEPYAFTEQGVAMLSSVLRSERAVNVNIEIMRAFVRMRRVLQEHAELGAKLAQLEKKYDGQFRIVFDAIRDLMAAPVKPKGRIGFKGESER
jgi:ORF6N domain